MKKIFIIILMIGSIFVVFSNNKVDARMVTVNPNSVFNKTLYVQGYVDDDNKIYIKGQDNETLIYFNELPDYMNDNQFNLEILFMVDVSFSFFNSIGGNSPTDRYDGKLRIMQVWKRSPDFFHYVFINNDLEVGFSDYVEYIDTKYLYYIAYFIGNVDYGEGYKVGYGEAYKVGFSDGENEGYALGKIDGFQDGVASGEGTYQGVFAVITNGIFAPIILLFNMEIFPHITLGMIILVPLIFGLIAFIIGGKKNG